VFLFRLFKTHKFFSPFMQYVKLVAIVKNCEGFALLAAFLYVSHEPSCWKSLGCILDRGWRFRNLREPPLVCDEQVPVWTKLSTLDNR
jgi:hypothetical protein